MIISPKYEGSSELFWKRKFVISGIASGYFREKLYAWFS